MKSVMFLSAFLMLAYGAVAQTDSTAIAITADTTMQTTKWENLSAVSQGSEVINLTFLRRSEGKGRDAGDINYYYSDSPSSKDESVVVTLKPENGIGIIVVMKESGITFKTFTFTPDGKPVLPNGTIFKFRE